MEIAVFPPSPEHAHLSTPARASKAVCTHTSELAGIMTAKAESRTGFIDRCWNDKPDVAALEVAASRAATEGAIGDLRQVIPAVRLPGVWTGRQRECVTRELLAVGPHGVASFHHGVAALVLQVRPGDTHEERKGEGRSLQSPAEPLPILERAQVSTQAPRQVDIQAHVSAGSGGPQAADRVGLSHRTIRKQSVAGQRGHLGRTDALVSQSAQSLPSA